MKVLIILLLFISCNVGKEKTEGEYKLYYKKGSNAGHRLGGDVFKKQLPDNTIEVLKACFKVKCYEHKTFKYFELDINSTKDHALVVHHDRCFKQKQYKSQPHYKKCIKDLTLEQIKEMRVWRKYSIPTFDSGFLDYFVNESIQGRILIEVKNIHSDEAREKLVHVVDGYRSKLDMAYLAFKKAFKRSFPDKNKWCKKLKLVHKAGGAKTKSNNFCR